MLIAIVTDEGLLQDFRRNDANGNFISSCLLPDHLDNLLHCFGLRIFQDKHLRNILIEKSRHFWAKRYANRIHSAPKTSRSPIKNLPRVLEHYEGEAARAHIERKDSLLL